MDFFENTLKNTSKELDEQIKNMEKFNKTVFNTLNIVNTEIVDGITKNVENVNTEIIRNIEDIIKVLGLQENEQTTTRKRVIPSQVNPYNE